MNPCMSGFIVYILSPVGAIYYVRNILEIIDFIVESVSVNMIESMSRILFIVKYPSHPMRQIGRAEYLPGDNRNRLDGWC